MDSSHDDIGYDIVRVVGPKDITPDHIAIIENIYREQHSGSIGQIFCHREWPHVRNEMEFLWGLFVPEYAEDVSTRLSEEKVKRLKEENEVAYGRLLQMLENIDAMCAQAQSKDENESNTATIEADTYAATENATGNPAYDFAQRFYRESGALLTIQDEVCHRSGDNPGENINWRLYPTIHRVASIKRRTIPDAIKKKGHILSNLLHVVRKDLREHFPEAHKRFVEISIAGRAKREQDSGDWFTAVVSSEQFRALNEFPRRQLVLLDLRARIERIRATDPELLKKGFTHTWPDCRVKVDPEEFRRIMKEEAIERLGWLTVKCRVSKGYLYVVKNAQCDPALHRVATLSETGTK